MLDIGHAGEEGSVVGGGGRLRDPAADDVLDVVPHQHSALDVAGGRVAGPGGLGQAECLARLDQLIVDASSCQTEIGVVVGGVPEVGGELPHHFLDTQCPGLLGGELRRHVSHLEGEAAGRWLTDHRLDARGEGLPGHRAAVDRRHQDRHPTTDLPSGVLRPDLAEGLNHLGGHVIERGGVDAQGEPAVHRGNGGHLGDARRGDLGLRLGGGHADRL